MFNFGLHSNLVHAIHMMETIPNDFNKYITMIMKIDSNISRSQTTITHNLSKNYHFHCPNSKPQCKDNDAMDVDCLHEEGHCDHMMKGLCFYCHKQGHHAAKCPTKEKDKKKKKVLVCQEKIKEESEDKVETCHLTDDF
jgi:hypothetical protein